MELLPKEHITLKQLRDGRIVAGLWNNNGYRHYEVYQPSELPNDLVSFDDLKRFGINLVDVKSIGGE